MTFITNHKDLIDPIAALSRHETEDFPGCASVGFMEVTGKTSCFSKLWKGGSRESLGEVNQVSVVAKMFLYIEVDVLYNVLFLDCLLMFFFVSVDFFHRG